jgi:hypothetical protein
MSIRMLPVLIIVLLALFVLLVLFVILVVLIPRPLTLTITPDTGALTIIAALVLLLLQNIA